MNMVDFEYDGCFRGTDDRTSHIATLAAGELESLRRERRKDMSMEHGEYSGVVDIARNGIDLTIRQRNELTALRQAAQDVIDAHSKTMAWFGEQMRKQGITIMTVNDVQAAELAAIQKLAEMLKPHNA